MKERQTKATEEYLKAIEEFDELIEAYTIWKDEIDDE